MAKQQYALIWWLSNGTTEVISCALIKSTHRVEGKTTKLYWVNKDGVRKLHDAKVLKINGKYNISKFFLNNIC